MGSWGKICQLILCCIFSHFYRALNGLRHGLKEKQHSPSSWFQTSQKCFADLSFILNHFSFLFLPSVVIQYIWISRKKSVHPFCSVERSIIITIIKPTFSDGQESVQNLNVYLCIYCSDNECHLLTSVMQPSIINDVGHFLAFFRQSSLYVSLEKYCIKVAAPSPLLVKICASWLKITFIQSSTVYACLSSAHCNLVLFFFVLVAICFSAYKSPFIQPISYCSITGTNFCFYLFVLHLFCCGFSIFKRLGQNTTL